MNIFQRINLVMRDAEYIKKGSAGQGTGVLYDEVIAMLRGLLIKNGIVLTVDILADNSRSVGEKKNYVYEGYYKISYINIEKPDDRLESFVTAHAMDSGDKAPGKAITYATKISILKVFALETGVNDESRSYESSLPEIITESEAENLKKLIEEAGADLKLFCKNFGCSSPDLLPKKSLIRARAMLNAKKGQK
jgi:hypothetical protein